jgi:hypothetical protein
MLQHMQISKVLEYILKILLNLSLRLIILPKKDIYYFCSYLWLFNSINILKDTNPSILFVLCNLGWIAVKYYPKIIFFYYFIIKEQ